MLEEIVIAGFGGQGVLSMGKILAYSGMLQDYEVSWIPSYGPEMRGGTANVTVIVSETEISSPVLNEYDTAILLNQQSVDKFESSIKPGGVLLYDSYGISNPPTRKDINVYKMDGMNAAVALGSAKVFNMVVLGAYLKIRPIVHVESVSEGLRKSLPERAHKLIPLNEQAVLKGMELVEEVNILS